MANHKEPGTAAASFSCLTSAELILPSDSEMTNDATRSLIFAKEVFQIRLGQAVSKPFLAQHVRDGLGFPLLEFPDLFLNRSRRNQAVGIDSARLANAVRTVDGLSFDGGIPPWIIEHHITG